MRYIPWPIILIFVVLSLGSVIAAAFLESSARDWAETRPLLFTLSGALLTVPITALVTTVVVESLLSLHERVRYRQIYEGRKNRLNFTINTTLSTLARALLTPEAAIPNGPTFGALLAAVLHEVYEGKAEQEERKRRWPVRTDADLDQLRNAITSYQLVVSHVQRIADADPSKDWIALSDDLYDIAAGLPRFIDRWEAATHRPGGPSRDEKKAFYTSVWGLVHTLVVTADAFQLPQEWSWPERSTDDAEHRNTH